MCHRFQWAIEQTSTKNRSFQESTFKKWLEETPQVLEAIYTIIKSWLSQCCQMVKVAKTIVLESKGNSLNSKMQKDSKKNCNVETFNLSRPV